MAIIKFTNSKSTLKNIINYITQDAKTRKEVKDKLNAILLSLKNGTYTNSNNILFIDWLSRWLETYAKPNIKLATYTSYETYIRGHLKPYF